MYVASEDARNRLRPLVDLGWLRQTGKNYSIVWSAKQMGGEKREPPKLTPEMERQLQELRKTLDSKR